MNKKAGMQGLVISFILVSLFIFSFIQFGINLSEKNGANQSVGDVPGILQLQSMLADNTTELESQSQAVKKSMEEDKGVFGGVLVFAGAIRGMFQLVTSVLLLPLALTEFAFTTFGGISQDNSATIALLLSPIIYTITMVVIIFGLWRFFKTGS